jgi:hypothetical protein
VAERARLKERVLFISELIPGPNPTTSRYNAVGSLARFENKKYLILLRKTLYVAYYNAGVIAVNLKVVRLAPGANPTIASYNASVVKFTALLIAWRVLR